MRSDLPSILTLFIVCMSSCHSKQFCEEFLKNGNKIDFVFRRLVVGQKFENPFNDTTPVEYFFGRLQLTGRMVYRPVFDLFIKGHYWRVAMDDPLDGLTLNFENKTFEGRDALFFNGYRMGADIPNVDQNFSESKAVLLSDSSVIFGHIPNVIQDNQTNYYLQGYVEYLSEGLTSNKMESPKVDRNSRLDFAFPPIPASKSVEIDFASKHKQKSKEGSDEYRLSFSRFRLENGFKQKDNAFKPVLIPPDQYSMFNSWTTPYDIVGVTTMPDTFMDLTLLILMADTENRVLFCMTLHDYTSGYCKFPNELIDCTTFESTLVSTDTTISSLSDVKPTVTPNVTPTVMHTMTPAVTSNDSNGSFQLFLIIAGILIGLVLIIIVVTVVYIFHRELGSFINRTEPQNQTEPESETRPQPERSGETLGQKSPDSGEKQ